MRSDARLALLARSAQWELDEAAFEIGGGRYTPEQRQRLAGQLIALAEELRGGDVQPIITGSDMA